MKTFRSACLFGVCAVLLSAVDASESFAMTDRYQGPGSNIVNSTVEGIERGMNLRCEAEKSDRLTFYFPGVPFRLEKRVNCRDADGRLRAIVKAIGRDHSTRQTFERVEIEYTNGSCAGDCEMRLQ